MTVTGYPDWQAYPRWQGSALVAGTVSVGAGDTATYAGYVSSFSAVMLSVSVPSGSPLAVTLNWYADDTEALNIIGYEWALYGDCNIVQVLVPSMGQYLSLGLYNPAGSAVEVTASCQPVNAAADRPAYQYTQVNLSGGFETVGAGDSVTAWAAHVMEGRGLLCVNSQEAGASWSAEIDTVDSGGNVLGYKLYQQDLTGDQDFEVTGSAYAMKLILSNTSTVANYFRYDWSVAAA